MRQSWSGKNRTEGMGCQRLILYSPNIVNLCMDLYNEERQEGSIYHRYTAVPIPFASLFEALKQMDSFYEELQYPQSSTKLRSFQVDRKKKKQMQELPEYKRKDMEEVESFESVTKHRGKDATFVIRVQYRQNSSWQGEVTWVDKRKKEHFRSALELVRLIDSAMEKAEN